MMNTDTKHAAAAASHKKA